MNIWENCGAKKCTFFGLFLKMLQHMDNDWKLICEKKLALQNSKISNPECQKLSHYEELCATGTPTFTTSRLENDLELMNLVQYFQTNERSGNYSRIWWSGTFNLMFYNEFGHRSNICHWLWFEKDMKQVSCKVILYFPKYNAEYFKLCNYC